MYRRKFVCTKLPIGKPGSEYRERHNGSRETPRTKTSHRNSDQNYRSIFYQANDVIISGIWRETETIQVSHIMQRMETPGGVCKHLCVFRCYQPPKTFMPVLTLVVTTPADIMSPISPEQLS